MTTRRGSLSLRSQVAHQPQPLRVTGDSRGRWPDSRSPARFGSASSIGESPITSGARPRLTSLLGFSCSTPPQAARAAAGAASGEGEQRTSGASRALQTPSRLPAHDLASPLASGGEPTRSGRRRDAAVPMLFPTIEFAIFFPIVLALSWALMSRPALWKPFIVLASYVFYAAADPRFCLLLGGITVGNQIAAQPDREHGRRAAGEWICGRRGRPRPARARRVQVLRLLRRRTSATCSTRSGSGCRCRC